MSVTYVGSLVIYNIIIDPCKYLLMTLDGIILLGLYEHERLKPVSVRASQENVKSLAEEKQVLHLRIKFTS